MVEIDANKAAREVRGLLFENCPAEKRTVGELFWRDE